MPSNALTQKVIKSTLNTLKSGTDGELDTTDLSPRDGLSVIDDWLKVLQESKPSEPVFQGLMQLRSMLQMPNPDTDLLKRLLVDLADNTHQLAQSYEGPWVNELEQIVDTLLNFSSQL
ncbi:hypothetical protein GCM10028803_41110 [Larkinella knui]|uniref:Uncharacterized protein n=1 Tax=Larkinella knui TaxID=2025310 RepID=A0A3P1CN34_9BACT|nr:hypothetical protein [Larkinella knui]RRB14743.1 hypothetical protein EHT87_09235 [Larkinella knui]